MKNKWLSRLMLVVFLFTIAIAPMAGSLQVVQAADTSSFVNEYAVIYPYLNDTEKAAMTTAKSGVEALTVWDSIITPLLQPGLISKFSDEATAKTALINFAKGMGNIYYASSVADLTTATNDFRSNYATDFHAIFGNEITVDQLYTLLTVTKQKLPIAVSASDATLKNQLAFGSNEELVGTPTVQGAVATVTIAAMKEALKEPSLAVFAGKLSAIDWTPELLVQQQRLLAQAVDSSFTAEMAIAKAGVRSQTELYKMVSGAENLIAKDTNHQIAFTLDGQQEYRLRIMGMEASTRLAWVSSNTAVATVSYTDLKGYPQLTPVASANGTTVVTAYRWSETGYQGTSDNDWVMKFTVTVGSPTEKGSLTGNILTPDSASTTVALAGVGVSIDSTTYTVTTDTNGAFTISDIPAGNYTVKLSKAGYAGLEQNITITAGSSSTFNNKTMYQWGDVNADGSINVSDAAAIITHFVKTTPLTVPNAADVTKDGSINVSDAAAIITYFVKETSLPVNQ